jgi:NAD-dependent histone deacetylase SIR2
MTITLDLAHLDDQHEHLVEASSTRKMFHALSLAVAKSKRMVVVTGAGISCSSGIPDFRSSDGLYNLVKSQHPNALVRGKDLFNAAVFRDTTTTQIFYTFMAELKSAIDVATPSPTHRFLKTLDVKGKLLRSYTQNIDGLEERAGLLGTSSAEALASSKGKAKLNVKDVKNVQLHGDIRRVQCTMCSATYDCEDSHIQAFKLGDPPECPDCVLRCATRVARSARPLSVGVLRPAVVLYDEPHPLGDEIGAISSRDIIRRPDLLVIMGTSLQVHGIKQLVKALATAVHQHTSRAKSSAIVNFMGKVIFVNRTPPSAEWEGIIDYWVKGETDLWVLKCEADWRKSRPQDWEIQTTLPDGSIVPYTEDMAGFPPPKLKVVKHASTKTKGGSKKHVPSPGTENTPPASAIRQFPITLPRSQPRDPHSTLRPSSAKSNPPSTDNAPGPLTYKLVVEIPTSQRKRPAVEGPPDGPKAKCPKTVKTPDTTPRSRKSSLAGVAAKKRSAQGKGRNQASESHPLSCANAGVA